ncbi:hypothetical protein EON64_12235 [archaeon]|nr:MAG: hypothetical protein EON64_12235 [archaeon]
MLNILANVAAGSKRAVSEVRVSLQGVSEWFDDYMAAEESTPGQEPELNKAMVLLLARCWDYKIKTEDVLELTKVRPLLIVVATCKLFLISLHCVAYTYIGKSQDRTVHCGGASGGWRDI